MGKWLNILLIMIMRVFQPPKEYQYPAEPEPVAVPEEGELAVIDDNYTTEEKKALLIEQYRTLEVETIGRQKVGHVSWYIKQIRKNELIYRKAAYTVSLELGLTGDAVVPWEIIAVMHAMEASFDMDEQILNGQRWDQVTTIVPKGMGPFKDFEESCVAGFKIKVLPPDWDLGNTLWFCERWNGLGYHYRNLNSPYNFAYSNHQRPGKFVADHVFDYEFISLQVGCAVMLKKLGYEGQGTL